MSDRFTKKRNELLAEHGFVLVRADKHMIYRDPEGRTLTFSTTPSDWRAVRNELRDIRRAMRDPQPDTTIDASVLKQETPAKGRARVFQPFLIYKGERASHRATPEETMRALRGYLASRNAYKFKSEFCKAAMKLFEEDYARQGATIRLTLERFDEIAKLYWLGRSLEHEEKREELERVIATVDEDTRRCLRTYDTFMQAGVENPEWGMMSLSEAHADVKGALQLFFEDWPRSVAKGLRLARELMGKVANRLWRGESSTAIKSYLSEHISGMDRAFDGQEIYADQVTRLVEDLAAEKIEEVETPCMVAKGPRLAED